MVFPLQQQAEGKFKWDNFLPLHYDSRAQNIHSQCSVHPNSDVLVNSASVVNKNDTLEIFVMVNHMVF